MESAMLLARIFGPFLAIVGLWMLLYGDNVVKIMTAMKNSPPALYITALITLFLGLLIINTYNIWSLDGFLVLTLLGWALFIRGVMGLFMNQLVVKSLMQNTFVMKKMGILPLIVGVILIWTGFYT